MVSPNSVFTELVTTTLREHPEVMYDNVSNHNALYNRLAKKKNVVKIDGGYEIVEPLEYAENSTYQRYSGYETLNIQASDVLSAAKFDWKYAAVNVTANGGEIRANNGKNKIMDLVKSRINVAKKTFANNLNADLYSAGTADSGKQIGGLQSIVADAGTGTVGGINSTTFDFWQNKVQDPSSPIQGGGSITPSKSTIKSLMNGLWINLVRGADTPDLIIADDTYFLYYEESLQDLQRYASADTGEAGFDMLKYKNADVVFDNADIPDSHMYFLNTDYLKFKVQKDAFMTPMDKKVSTNQDAEVVPLLLQANLCCANRSLQGVIV